MKASVKTIQLDKAKIISQINDLGNISKINNWEFLYDEDLDQIYFSPKHISDDFILRSFNDDISVYVDEKSNINGIFIEYFKADFLEHDIQYNDKEEKKTIDLVMKKLEKQNTQLANQNKQLELLQKKLAEKLLQEVKTQDKNKLVYLKAF